MAAVQARVTGDDIFLATVRCSTDVETMEWDTDDVARLIRALLPQDYRHSEWCESSRGVVGDADVYRIDYDPITGYRGNASQHRRYYLKYGFRPNDTRLLLWVFSCHLSRSY